MNEVKDQRMLNVANCMLAIGGTTENFDDGNKLLPNSGLYVKYLKISPGEMVIGKKHLAWGANILACGTLILMDDIKGEKVEITGPIVFESAPGSQKIVKALTECVFVNVFRSGTDETTSEIENRIVEDMEGLVCHHQQ